MKDGIRHRRRLRAPRVLESMVQRHRCGALLSEFRPIASDAEHAAAVAEMRKLLDAAPGTAAAEKLATLGMLVEEYEERHFGVSDD